MSVQCQANGRICLGNPDSRGPRSEEDKWGPRPRRLPPRHYLGQVSATRLSLPPGSGGLPHPQQPPPGLLQGPAAPFSGGGAEILCRVNGAPGLWEPGGRAAGRPGLCLRGPAGPSAFP